MTHERYEESTGAYVLDALPELERQAFETHMQRCDDCRREVERLRVGADALAAGAVQVEPPPGLKASLMEVVEREARERELAAETAHAPARREPAPAVREREPAAPRRRLGDLLPSLPRLRPSIALVAAATLLALGVGFGLSEVRDEGDDTRTLTAEVDETRLPRATARLIVSEDDRPAVLRTKGMPSLERGAVYQVWIERDGEISSASMFAVGPDGTGAGALPEGLEGVDAVMVTREPAGGSRVPTEKPVVSVRL